MKTLKTYKVKAFTLIEMLVSLIDRSVLLLLFVPGLITKRLRERDRKSGGCEGGRKCWCTSSIIPMTKLL